MIDTRKQQERRECVPARRFELTKQSVSIGGSIRVAEEEEVFGYEWMPKGLKKGSAPCRWMEATIDGDRCNKRCRLDRRVKEEDGDTVYKELR